MRTRLHSEVVVIVTITLLMCCVSATDQEVRVAPIDVPLPPSPPGKHSHEMQLQRRGGGGGGRGGGGRGGFGGGGSCCSGSGGGTFSLVVMIILGVLTCLGLCWTLGYYIYKKCQGGPRRSALQDSSTPFFTSSHLQGGTDKCRRNHPLRYEQSPVFWECDICDRGSSRNTWSYRCSLCDYDVCERCHVPAPDANDPFGLKELKSLDRKEPDFSNVQKLKINVQPAESYRPPSYTYVPPQSSSATPGSLDMIQAQPTTSYVYEAQRPGKLRINSQPVPQSSNPANRAAQSQYSGSWKQDDEFSML